MRYDLATLARRARPGLRKKVVIIRDIIPPATLATNLYRSAYLPAIEVWERAATPILEAYARALSSALNAQISADSAGGGVPESTTLFDSPDDLQARLDAAGSELERLFIMLDAALRDWGVQVEQWQRGKWRGAVLSATGVDINTLIGPEDMRETIATYLRWNTSLIRDVSAQARQRISSAVFAGLQNRTPVREVAKQVSEATGFARARSKRIAQDQLSKISSALADERRREAGIDVWKWRHSRKLHPRKHHQAREGKLYADTAGDAGVEVDGQTVNPPPEDDDLPGRPPFCGCRPQAVLVLD